MGETGKNHSGERDLVEPTPEQARALLEGSGKAFETVLAEGRWVVRYLLVFAAAAAVLIPPVAFVTYWPVAVVVCVLWSTVLVGLLVWSARRRATPLGAYHRMGSAFMLFGVLYGITCLLGFTVFVGELAWWIPGGLASAVPLLIAAIREARR